MGKPIVLLVDDNPVNLQVLIEYLKKAEYTILIAQSGEDALQKVEEIHPDLILLDVLMPGMNGFETCRKLKEKEATKDIPIIFMTVLSSDRDKIKGFEVGGADYITKPFHYKEVLARVNAHLTVRNLQKQLWRRSSFMNHEDQDTVNQKKTTIMIVDDNPLNLTVLINYLNQLDFRILIAQSGEDAIQKLAHTKADLILLDVLMPSIDGFETCLRLKQNSATRYIPVIFMTVLSDTKDIIRGFEVGGADYIAKPFNYSELLARINVHLTIQKLQRQLS